MNRERREPRRFTRAQRAALYSAADGCCENCGTPLESGWHADHDTPWSLGGPTNLRNGRALCPPCNLLKGSTVEYRDTFDPRPFQEQVIEKVIDGFATRRRVTIALGTPGTGKTLGYQATATHLLREGLIDYVAVFAPRVSLASQCEIDWMHRDKDTKELKGHFLLFDEKRRFGKIRHVAAASPLTQPGATGTGFVTTYSALATSKGVFLEWAEEHQGRFLLVADEAQFCGAPDEKGGGTQAGALIEKMHEFSAHTLLLTGTPYRADNQKLILADYSSTETEEGEGGKAKLLRHVTATYADGVEQEYLRRFEFQLQKGLITETDVARTWSQQYSLSSADVDLREVLRKATTWQPLADLVVQSVREKQILNPAYRGLISCIDQKEAEAAANYLKSRYPGLRVYLAVSADGAQGQKALQEFKTQAADVLVTVRMAFIGYDCKTITVVGILTHYRNKGHLMQLIGRGLRVWDEEPYDEQTLRVICPDDSRMQEFLDWLKAQEDEGLRRRKERERTEGDDDAGREPQGSLSFIESTEMTGIRAVSNEVEVDDDEWRLIQGLKEELSLSIDVTQLAQFAELYGIRSKEPSSEGMDSPAAPRSSSPSTPMTDAQQIGELKSQTAEAIKEYLAGLGILGGNPNYGLYTQKITATVNRGAGYTSNQVRTIEQAEARLRAARALRGQP